jgi:hypothetical protein
MSEQPQQITNANKNESAHNPLYNHESDSEHGRFRVA